MATTTKKDEVAKESDVKPTPAQADEKPGERAKGPDIRTVVPGPAGQDNIQSPDLPKHKLDELAELRGDKKD